MSNMLMVVDFIVFEGLGDVVVKVMDRVRIMVRDNKWLEGNRFFEEGRDEER